MPLNKETRPKLMYLSTQYIYGEREKQKEEVCVLWHIGLCKLFNTCFYIYIYMICKRTVDRF